MVLWVKMVSFKQLFMHFYILNKKSVSPLEWINCGSDTEKTYPDDSMNNSTEEEDQV